jgi:hypothetical protein
MLHAQSLALCALTAATVAVIIGSAEGQQPEPAPEAQQARLAAHLAALGDSAAPRYVLP